LCRTARSHRIRVAVLIDKPERSSKVKTERQVLLKNKKRGQ